MSFLFDDDDEPVPLSQRTAGGSSSSQHYLSQSSLLSPPQTPHLKQASQQAQSQGGGEDGGGGGDDDFHCLNCGGNEAYEEDGNLICSQCYTQSQSQIAATQEEFDVIDVAELAGRTANAGFVAARAAPGGSGGGKKKRQPLSLEAMNTAHALVDTTDCILGFQTILMETTRISYQLATSSTAAGDGDSTKQKQQHFKIILKSMHKIWSSYLKSWYDGAEYFGRLYPEIRFCFRDQFLDAFTKSKVLRSLVYWETQTLRDQIQRELDEETSDSSSEEDDDDDSNNDDNDPSKLPGFVNIKNSNNSDDGDDDHNSVLSTESATETTSGKQRKRNKYLPPQIDTMLLHHYGGGRCGGRKTKRKVRIVGRRAAALVLRPSMSMIASMIWIVLAPLGITGSHIQEWIGNGSLPLLDTFRLLSPRQQQRLQDIRGFFKLSSVPSISVLERNIRAIHVACRHKPRRIVVRKHATMNRSIGEGGGVNHQDGIQKFISKSNFEFEPGRIITPSSVPIVAARFVSELGFNQNVLDFTYSLMGLKVARMSNGIGWLPPPINKARPDRLLQPAKILAVIAVACKLVPEPHSFSKLTGWHLHRYKRPLSSSSRKTIRNDDDDDGNVLRRQPEGDGNHNNNTPSKRARRFVPWGDHHFRYISHGSLMTDYLDFLEDEVIAVENPLVVDSIEELKYDKPRESTRSADTQTATSKVIPSTTIAHFNDQPRSTAAKTEKRKSKQTRMYETSKNPESSGQSYTPLSGPMGPLVEHMANMSGTSPVDIIDFVSQLDKSLEKRDLDAASTIRRRRKCKLCKQPANICPGGRTGPNYKGGSKVWCKFHGSRVKAGLPIPR